MTSEQYTDDFATYIVNIPFDLINDKCYPLHAKTTFLFLLWLLLIQQFLTSQGF